MNRSKQPPEKLSKTSRKKALSSITELKDLKHDPKNARKHNPRNIGMIEKSLKDVGAARSIVIDENGVVLAGNGLIDAAALAGIDKVRVVEASGEEIIAVQRTGLNAKQKKRLALYDNRSSELSEWDADVIADIAKSEKDLLEGMFEEKELREIVAQSNNGGGEADAEPQIDRAAELHKKWGTARGQVWKIGEHRLMCGDSTSKDDVGKLMGGEKANASITDPPYGVIDEEWDRFPTQDDLNMWMAQTNGACVAFGAARPDCLFALLTLEPRCERIYVWWNTFTLTHSEGAFWQWQPIYIWRRNKFVDMGCDVISMAANTGGDKKMHVTQKPERLMAMLINASTKTGESVFDPFNGSGTTLIACQNLNRKCRAMEIAPEYVAVALERMATAFPDLKIELIDEQKQNGKAKRQRTK